MRTELAQDLFLVPKAFAIQFPFSGEQLRAIFDVLKQQESPKKAFVTHRCA